MDTEAVGFGSWGWVILIFLFFLGFGSGNGFGGGESASTIYARQASEASADNGKAIISQGYEAQLATMDSSYKALLGFKDSQYQMQQCCCDIKKEILEQAQLTRDLINANTITNLRAELVEARDTIVTNAQTQVLLNTLAPRAFGVYPYIY